MRQLNRSVAFWVFLFVAMPHFHCIGQQFQGNFKTRVVYERVLEQGPQEVPRDYRNSYFTKSNRGILTRQGTELLLNVAVQTVKTDLGGIGGLGQ